MCFVETGGLEQSAGDLWRSDGRILNLGAWGYGIGLNLSSEQRLYSENLSLYALIIRFSCIWHRVPKI